MERELEVTVDWVRERLREGKELFFIELRHAGDADLAVKKVRGALRVNTDDALRHLSEIPKERVVVVCSAAPTDEPAYRLARQMRDRDFQAHLLLGGFNAYLAAGLPVEEVGPAADMTRVRGL